jgi:hypothetical protein
MTTFNAITTFLNVAEDKETGFLATARSHFATVIDDFEFYQDNGLCKEDHDYADCNRKELIECFDGDRSEVREVESVLNKFDELGDFYDYGLSFDFMEADKNSDAYFRFQICWGGPSSEIRFYQDGTIEAVYLDWFCGVGFNVTTMQEFEWLADHFSYCCMLEFGDYEPEQLHQYYHLDQDAEEGDL